MWPKVSFLIPTLNAEKVLETCLNSIAAQDYQKENIEIVIADGGSTDATLTVAKKYGAIIVKNPLKTAESGKMVALKTATGEFCALVDSDNELPNKMWLQNMIKPLLTHPEALGSEPLSYTLRSTDGFITRYCALIGMNDPLVHFLGNYDRINLLTQKWTETPHTEQDFPTYLLVTFNKAGIPTIGANGTVFRTQFLKSRAIGDYLFDVDVLAGTLDKEGEIKFIKVKEGIIHSYCESDVKKFATKQRRRVKDFLYHKDKGNRTYPWNKTNYFGYIKFILSCVTVLPLIWQTIVGYLRKKDTAWFFHPIACEITLWEYGTGVLRGFLSKAELDRSNWRQ
jgi:glycosyltransferase involved in cell wall biosynthesis